MVPEPIINFHASAADPDDLSERVSTPTWGVKYEPLKARSKFQHEINICTNGSLIALRTESVHGFQADVTMAVPDRFELHFVEKGHYQSRSGKDNLVAESGQAYLLRNVTEHRIVSQPRTRQLCISIPIERCARLLALETNDPWTEMVQLRPMADFHDGSLKILHGLSSLLIGGQRGKHPLSSAPLAASLIEEAFIGSFVEAWPGVSRVDLSSKLSTLYVKRAIEWIESHPARKIRLEDLAAAGGVSVRTLQSGFKNQLGISPLSYVIKTRLQYVHRELMQGDPHASIEDIALKWGFTHMGDFSMRYRKLFGHPPSQTQKLGRRRE
jgi:AraC-like DNA-binding protein